MKDEDIKKQQSAEANNESQKPASTEPAPLTNEPAKKEDDRSDWVVIESGLGIDE